MNFIFLAAGKSSRIFREIKKPKCLIKVGKKTLIENLINKVPNLKKNKIYIVVGFKSKLIKKTLKNYKNIKFVQNKFYTSRDMLYSLAIALKKIKGNSIISYSDIYFKKNIYLNLIKKKNFIYLPVLKNWKEIWRKRKQNMYKDAETLKINKRSELLEIGEKIKKLSEVKYQYMGIIFLPEILRKKFLSQYEKIKKLKKMHITKFLNILIKQKIGIKCIKVKDDWYEFDNKKDLINFINK